MPTIQQISYSSDKSEELDLVINKEISCIERWPQGNKRSINVVKTQAMIIGSKPKKDSCQIAGFIYARTNEELI